jgi:HAD superfamily hydrolase (TIGR01509 family)
MADGLDGFAGRAGPTGPVRAVAFDIGGVLEFTPETGWAARWEERLGLPPRELNRRLGSVWRAGGIGTISEHQVVRAVREVLRLGPAQADALMDDMWAEYVGTPNTEMIEYARGLRARRRTGIISNSFVGARWRERDLYHFEDVADVIVYSHEVGVAKPDPAIFGLACEALEVEPGELVFVDDNQGHVAAARALGIQAILFTGNAAVIAGIEGRLAA